MDDDSSGFSSELLIAFDTHAGPAVVHGPRAEPDSPPLAPVTVAAVEALVAMAVTDGVPVHLEHPAVRGTEPADWPLPSAWLRLDGGGGVGMSAWGPEVADFPEPVAEEAARVVDTAHEAVLEWMPGCGSPTNWPPCPEHPTTHPLAVVAGDEADPRPRWACPRTGVVALPPLG